METQQSQFNFIKKRGGKKRNWSCDLVGVAIAVPQRMLSLLVIIKRSKKQKHNHTCTSHHITSRHIKGLWIFWGTSHCHAIKFFSDGAPVKLWNLGGHLGEYLNWNCNVSFSSSSTYTSSKPILPLWKCYKTHQIDFWPLTIVIFCFQFSDMLRF